MEGIKHLRKPILARRCIGWRLNRGEKLAQGAIKNHLKIAAWVAYMMQRGETKIHSILRKSKTSIEMVADLRRVGDVLRVHGTVVGPL